MTTVTENEKYKDIKETSEVGSFEDFGAMENGEEASGMEEAWFSENDVPPTGQSVKDISDTECTTSSESSLKNSYEEKKKLLLKEKWLTVTGRKPRSIPVIKTIFNENTSKFIGFGDRRQIDMEKQMLSKIMITAKKFQTQNITYGKVRHEMRLQSLNQGVMSVKFSPDGNFLAISERMGGVEIRRTATGKIASRLNTIEENQGLAVRTMEYYPGGNQKLYIAGDFGVIQLYDTNSGALLSSSERFETINVMAINADGKFLATGGKAGQVCVIDINTFQPVWIRGCIDIDSAIEPSVDDDYHRGRVYGLKFHPSDVNCFVTGSWDNAVKMWDIRVPKAIGTICGPAIYGNGLDMKENSILTASWRTENSISLWDFPSGQLIKNIPINSRLSCIHGEFLYAAEFFKNNHPAVNNNLIAVGGSGFSEVLIINIYTEKVEKYFPSFKVVLSLNIYQNMVAYGGKESILRIAELTGPLGRR